MSWVVEAGEESSAKVFGLRTTEPAFTFVVAFTPALASRGTKAEDPV